MCTTKPKPVLKVGQTGTFFSPGNGVSHGKFIPCRILNVYADTLRVQLPNCVEISIGISDFNLIYMAVDDNLQCQHPILR